MENFVGLLLSSKPVAMKLLALPIINSRNVTGQTEVIIFKTVLNKVDDTREKEFQFKGISAYNKNRLMSLPSNSSEKINETTVFLNLLAFLNR